MNWLVAVLAIPGGALCAAADPAVAVLDFGYGQQHAAGLARTVSGRTVHPDAIASLAPGTLLVLPEALGFPAAAVPQVEAFLDRGGHLLVLGGPPFETLLYERDGHWGTLEEVLARVPAEHTLLDWSRVDPTRCERGTNQPQVPIDTAVEDGRFTLQTNLIDPVGWDTVMVRPVSPAPADHNVLLFEASGSGKAKGILIELHEKDGTRWMAEAPVTDVLAPMGLPVERFAHWRDSTSSGRGGPGDRVNLANVDYVAVGFASSHQMLSPGDHGFTLGNLSTGRTDGAFAVPQIPRLEGLSPSYKLFEGTASRLESQGPMAGLTLAHGAGWSPVPRAMHASDDRGYFWQPLVKGYDDRGFWVFTPLSITWRRDGGSWTLYGNPPRETDAALAEFGEVVRRLQSIIAEGPRPAPAPELLPQASQGACVGVEAGEFRLDGRRWFAHGINYWPLYVSGMEPQGYFSHWLSPMFYIPELIDQDLATLESMGVNLVSIQYTKTEEAPQLRDFLERCGRHGIKANIWIVGAHPTEPAADDDLSKREYLDLLRAADLAGNPHVFAYDLAWEPILGHYDGRRKHDRLFEAWLAEQYGSVDRAERVWGVAANRRDGRVTGPFDDQLMQDGPHRPMVAAYRRFADDLVSRRYREVIRLARRIDDTHLFGVRTGCGGSGTLWAVPMFPYQLTSGTAHLDFTSPEGYGYGPVNIADAALVTRYALWAGNGKPVFWSEFGQHVWQGGDVAIRQQEALYRAFADMVIRSGAQGWAGWWFPGGYRVDERSDYGIVDQGWVLRPSARVLQEMAGPFHDAAPPPVQGALVVEPEQAPQGLAQVVREHSETFRRVYDAGAVLDVRTRGTGTTSADCPFTGLGGMAFEAPAPVEFLNAEVALLDRQGDTVRVEVINTGEATLLPDDCRLVVRGDGEATVALPEALPRFGRVELTFSAAGPFTARMHADRFGPFGERLQGP